jgi:hypothetical protein
MLPIDCRKATDLSAEMGPTFRTDPVTIRTATLPTSVLGRGCRCRQVPTGNLWCRYVPTGTVGAEGCAARYPPYRAALSVPNLQFRDIPKMGACLRSNLLSLYALHPSNRNHSERALAVQDPIVFKILVTMKGTTSSLESPGV